MNLQLGGIHATPRRVYINNSLYTHPPTCVWLRENEQIFTKCVVDLHKEPTRLYTKTHDN